MPDLYSNDGQVPYFDSMPKKLLLSDSDPEITYNDNKRILAKSRA